jgi:hypothetical protein
VNPTNAIALTGALVVLGKWSADQKLSVRIIVGLAGATLGLAVVNEMNEELAGKMAVLVLITAVFMYGPAVAWKAGLLDHAKYPKAPGLGVSK